MIVCHCNVVSDREIEDVVESLLADDPWTIIVPNLVYREMEKRGRCCSCFPNVIDIIIRVTNKTHSELSSPANDVGRMTAVLETMKTKTALAKRG